jgi:hypothetical protein
VKIVPDATVLIRAHNRSKAMARRLLHDTDVLQTAERGEADILCTHDGDFYDEAVLSFCATRGIEVCTEKTLMVRLAQRYI